MIKPKVLFVCTESSCRSQMAEGLLRHQPGEQLEVPSAGTKPSSVRSEAMVVRREIGVDISSQRSKSVEEFAGQPFHCVITVCDNAKKRCPIFPAAAKHLHWSFDDPC